MLRVLFRRLWNAAQPLYPWVDGSTSGRRYLHGEQEILGYVPLRDSLGDWAVLKVQSQGKKAAFYDGPEDFSDKLQDGVDVLWCLSTDPGLPTHEATVSNFKRKQANKPWQLNVNREFKTGSDTPTTVRIMLRKQCRKVHPARRHDGKEIEYQYASQIEKGQVESWDITLLSKVLQGFTHGLLAEADPGLKKNDGTLNYLCFQSLVTSGNLKLKDCVRCCAILKNFLCSHPKGTSVDAETYQQVRLLIQDLICERHHTINSRSPQFSPLILLFCFFSL